MNDNDHSNNKNKDDFSTLQNVCMLWTAMPLKFCRTPWFRVFDLLCNKFKTSCIVNKAVKKANNNSISDVLA